MTKIKICGIQSAEEATWLAENEADYAGMVLFYEKSKRVISIEKAYQILRILKIPGKENRTKVVAVTVSPTVEQIAIIQKLGFDYIQVHGKLEKASFEAIQIPMIRAINGENFGQLERFAECQKVCAVLFDAAEYGSGKTIDWHGLKVPFEQVHKHEKLCVLAGGLNSENVREAIAIADPDIVDVSTGVEAVDGVGKDRKKIEAFIGKVRTNE